MALWCKVSPTRSATGPCVRIHQSLVTGRDSVLGRQRSPGKKSDADRKLEAGANRFHFVARLGDPSRSAGIGFCSEVVRKNRPGSFGRGRPADLEQLSKSS